jgi:SAM-dependent methyltransferase
MTLKIRDTRLCKLARKHGTDKGGDHLQRGDTCHNYTPAYSKLFHHWRWQVEAVLEIGIGGGHSLRMWKEYFPNAQIYGIDCDPSCLAQIEDRIHCFVADQANEADLLRVMKAIGNEFDLIIDDGSHEPAHQIFTAQVLLPYLAANGLYVIEDIEPDCQPQLIGNPIVDKLKNYAWNPFLTGRGLGRAYCRCGCEGGERLIVIRHV